MYLEDQYTTDDLSLFMKSITELTSKKDFETLNIQFSHNSDARKFNTRKLNEDISQENKRFCKKNEQLCNVTKTNR